MNRYVVIDTETTGFTPHKGDHRIIEIALVEVVDYVITGKQFQTYLIQIRAISKFDPCTQVH